MLAQQLTHIELERLSFIGPEEFVQAFAKENPNIETSFKDMKKTRNLESYIQWFNRLSYFVATQVCSVNRATPLSACSVTTAGTALRALHRRQRSNVKYYKFSVTLSSQRQTNSKKKIPEGICGCDSMRRSPVFDDSLTFRCDVLSWIFERLDSKGTFRPSSHVSWNTVSLSTSSLWFGQFHLFPLSVLHPHCSSFGRISFLWIPQ